MHCLPLLDNSLTVSEHLALKLSVAKTASDASRMLVYEADGVACA